MATGIIAGSTGLFAGSTGIVAGDPTDCSCCAPAPCTFFCPDGPLFSSPTQIAVVITGMTDCACVDNFDCTGVTGSARFSRSLNGTYCLTYVGNCIWQVEWGTVTYYSDDSCATEICSLTLYLQVVYNITAASWEVQLSGTSEDCGAAVIGLGAQSITCDNFYADYPGSNPIACCDPTQGPVPGYGGTIYVALTGCGSDFNSDFNNDFGP